MEFFRTNQHHPEFVRLVGLLNAALAVLDGEDHAFYDQYNGMAGLDHVVLALEKGSAVGCGAFKDNEGHLVEIKRMYVEESWRGKGVASAILRELEVWARSEGAQEVILETGIRQPDAIRLYQKAGYRPIENYGPYRGVVTSLCFAKSLE